MQNGWQIIRYYGQDGNTITSARCVPVTRDKVNIGASYQFFGTEKEASQAFLDLIAANPDISCPAGDYDDAQRAVSEQ